jgi:hypothetical protein
MRVITAVDCAFAPLDDLTFLQDDPVFSAISFVLFAAAPGAHPVVSVDTSALNAGGLAEADARRLRGALLVRLNEEGYAVAPSAGDVQIMLTVRPAGAGWSVEARGLGVRDYYVDPGPVAVQSLEILQRATMALDSVGEARAPKPAPRRLSVALEVSGAGGDPEVSRLHEEIATEVVDAGMVLTPRWLPHDRLLCAALGESTISIAAGEKGADCTSPTSEEPRDDRSPKDLAFAVRKRAIAMLATTSRAAAGAAPRVLERSTGPLDSAPKGFTADHVARATHATSDSTWRFAAWTGAGVLARGGGVDPLAQLKIDLGTPSRFGGRLQAALDWSNGSAPLSIIEWQAQIGPTWSVLIASSTTFTSGLLAGVLVHRFYYDQVDNGSRIDWNFAAPAELLHRWGRTTLGIGLLAGISGPPRDHEISGHLAWHRGPLYIGVTAGLGMVL